MEKAYENLKKQEQQLEENLSHISEEVKGTAPPIRLPAAIGTVLHFCDAPSSISCNSTYTLERQMSICRGNGGTLSERDTFLDGTRQY